MRYEADDAVPLHEEAAYLVDVAPPPGLRLVEAVLDVAYCRVQVYEGVLALVGLLLHDLWVLLAEALLLLIVPLWWLLLLLTLDDVVHEETS